MKRPIRSIQDHGNPGLDLPLGMLEIPAPEDMCRRRLPIEIVEGANLGKFDDLCFFLPKLLGQGIGFRAVVREHLAHIRIRSLIFLGMPGTILGRAHWRVKPNNDDATICSVSNAVRHVYSAKASGRKSSRVASTAVRRNPVASRASTVCGESLS